MRGIILAGGAGTRLHPLTRVVSKQLLPIYDKPMIYYPLSTLMLAGVREVLIISTPRDLPMFMELLGDGSRLGMTIEYEEQPEPKGLAQAFLIGRNWLRGGPAALILGDNLFHGNQLSELVVVARQRVGYGGSVPAQIFGCRVRDPERYGVVVIDEDGRAVDIQEKPKRPVGNLAVPGLYFYDGTVCDRARELEPSARGELEITDLNRSYLETRDLRVEVLGRGVAWLDTGTHASLAQASAFVQTIEERQGLKIGCVEEVAFHHGWIGTNELDDTIATCGASSYADYLRELVL